jgi:hypothetical protein
MNWLQLGALTLALIVAAAGAWLWWTILLLERAEPGELQRMLEESDAHARLLARRWRPPAD